MSSQSAVSAQAVTAANSTTAALVPRERRDARAAQPPADGAAGAVPRAAAPGSGSGVQTPHNAPAGTPLTAGGQRWRRVALGALLPVTALAATEIAVRSGVIPSHLLPAPTQILDTLADLGAHGLLGHIGPSTLRVAAGFGIGALLAVLLGATVGLSRRAEALLDPTFQALRAIPSLAWVPLLLLWLGIDEAPKLVLIAIGAFFPIYMGVASGIRGVDRKLIEVARLYRLSNFALTRRVLLPAALPSILTGLRNGLSLAWMFMVAAELIAASRGLGYLLSDGRETSRADIVLAAIALLAILGKVSDSLMAAIEHRCLAWRDSYEGALTA
ncbi:ABC transporter permease [Duganella aceris]|uniref:ABC transporter permease n=1 Tax=Duganella aceris TaxID=2703883 RepID=A0ABX0FJX7_9BURK|nr:ABC transporter permease [Duganella aceris]NGZ84824.1 ABC transporter permease [Duganella aceris]